MENKIDSAELSKLEREDSAGFQSGKIPPQGNNIVNKAEYEKQLRTDLKPGGRD